MASDPTANRWVRDLLATNDVTAAQTLKARYRARVSEPLASMANRLETLLGKGVPLDRLAQLADQNVRDLQARDIYGRLLSDQHSAPFSLYLRPFKSTGALHLKKEEAQDRLRQAGIVEVVKFDGSRSHEKQLGFDGIQHMSSITIGSHDRHWELEGGIMKALEARAPLVCLGARLEHVGAGRIEVSDDAWKDAVDRLASKAELIIAAPSSQPGTLWEIDYLLTNRLIDRCIFVDMPDPRISRGTWNQAEEWEKIRQSFARHGYDLPEDDFRGLFLYFGRQKTPLLATHIGEFEYVRLMAFFDAVLKDKRESAV